jgi:predicted PurR-regulated permease PerM
MDFNARNVRILLGIITFGIVLNWGMQNVHNLGSVVDGLGIVLRPVLIGCGLAFVLSVPMRAIERLLSKPKLARMRFLTRIKRPLAITLSFLLVIFILLFVTFMVVPGVINAITALIDELPAFFEQLKTWSADLFVRYPDIQAFQLNWDNIGAQIINFLKNTVIGLLDSTVQTVSNLFTGVFNAFIGIVIAINLLVQKEKIGAQIRKLLYSFLPERAADETIRIVRLTNSTFSHFITGQCTEAVIFGALCFVGLSLLRMPHTMMLSVLLGFSTLIPIFGATIATILGAFLILLVNPLQAFWFVVFVLVLQQVEGNLIYPHVVGTSVGLPGIWVLISVLIGGEIMGVLGMLVSVPACSVLYCLLRDIVDRRLKRRKIDTTKLEVQKKTEV